jgi:hypothetical protein
MIVPVAPHRHIGLAMPGPEPAAVSPALPLPGRCLSRLRLAPSNGGIVGCVPLI